MVYIISGFICVPSKHEPNFKSLHAKVVVVCTLAAALLTPLGSYYGRLQLEIETRLSSKGDYLSRKRLLMDVILLVITRGILLLSAGTALHAVLR